MKINQPNRHIDLSMHTQLVTSRAPWSKGWADLLTKGKHHMGIGWLQYQEEKAKLKPLSLICIHFVMINCPYSKVIHSIMD
jgi:hypothetical protein